MSRAETARQAAIDRVGDAYVYGAWDQLCNVRNRNKYANLSKSYAEKIKNQCQRQKGKKSSCDGCRYNGRRIHDCRGLTSSCAKAAGISSITGQTVGKQWNQDVWERKGEIATLPKELPYVQLFRYDGSKWAHTGIWIGGGETVDARGHAKGVIRGKLAEYPWTHWAIPRGMYENAEESGSATGGERPIPPPADAGGPPFPGDPGRVNGDEGGNGVREYNAVVTVKSGRLNMRSGPGPEYPVIFKLTNGTPVLVVSEYPNGWAFVDEDGTQGYVSLAYLTPTDRPESAQDAPEGGDGQTPAPADEAQSAQDSAQLWAVWIACDSEDEARRYAGNIKGAVVVRYEKPPGQSGGEGE